MTSPTRWTPSVRPSAARFSTAASVGAKRPARQVVRHDAIDLLRHPAIERAQPGLDVRDRHVHLGRHERRRQRRIRVAVDDHRVGRDVAERALQRDQHPAGLLGAGPTADPQRHVRRPQPELAEEAAGHRLVPVLPGIDEDLVVPLASADWRAAALMSCGRVPTTFASRIRRREPAGAKRQPVDDLVRDPVAGVTVPQRRSRPARAHRAGEDRPRRRRHLVGRHQPVRAVADRDRPFGVRPHRQARDVEDRRLLLDPARVGQDEPRPGDQRQERQVAEWLDDAQPIAVAQPGGLEGRAAARVQRDDEREQSRRGRRAPPPTARALAAPSTFDGRCSVTTPYASGRPSRSRSSVESNARGARAACRSSGCRRSGSARPARRSTRSRSSASGLVVNSSSASRSLTTRLISSGIERSKERRPASTCADRDRQLGGDEARRERAVDVAVDHRERRRIVRPCTLEADHRRGRLLGMRARADAEIDVRRREVELAEEDVAHPLVVVLAGVDRPAGGRPARAAPG